MVSLCTSNTYSRIEKKSDLLWRFQRHKVVTRFVSKPAAPHPFAWISLLLASRSAHSVGSDGSPIRVGGADLSQKVRDSIEFLETQSVKRVIKSIEEVAK